MIHRYPVKIDLITNSDLPRFIKARIIECAIESDGITLQFDPRMPCTVVHMEWLRKLTGVEPKTLATDPFATNTPYGHKPPSQAVHASPIKSPGTLLWEELFSRSDPDQTWLDGWYARLQSDKARGQYRAWVEKNPPVFGAGWLEWITGLRNYVHTQIGKPPFTQIDAQNFRDQILNLQSVPARSGQQPKC